MRGSNVSDALDEVAAREAKADRSGAITLTPDWLERLMGRTDPFEQAVALPRGAGTAAGMARWRAQVIQARLRGDRNAERDACWWLAARLADADRDLGEALDYARQALELGGEDAWRVQVSTWLERAGSHREAAAVLAPCVTRAAAASEAAKLLMRMARLQVRADEPQLAMENLLEAATVWPSGAEALELAGELAAANGTSDATTMLLEAADRHEQNGNRGRAFEARRRAFEAAPTSVQACEALADTLEQSERFEAADGVRLAHARASEPAVARATHASRLSRAIEAGDSARALAAIVQGQLEVAIAEPFARDVDEALSGAGLHDAIAARWEWGTSGSLGPQRARLFLDLAGLYLGRLASPDRAVDAWIEAVAADPGCGEARAALRTHARSMHDQTALTEALIRAVRANPEGPTAVDCLREIADLAEERLSEPSLAHWALSELIKRTPDDPKLDAARSLLTPRVKLQDSALTSARKAVAEGDMEARMDGWRRMASILRGRPDEVDLYLDVLTQLVRTGPGERRWWLDFERAAVRCGRGDLLEKVAREQLAEPVPRSDVLHFRLTLITHAWRRGDPAAALRDALALAKELPDTRAAHSHIWIAATATGQVDQRAVSLELLAPNLSASVRAALLSLAGAQWDALGNDDETERLAIEARETDGTAPQVLQFLASRAARAKDPTVARSLERLASVYLPTSQHHADLTFALSQAGDYDLAHAWVRRWVELRPWDTAVVARLVESSTASTVEMQATAILRATACALPCRVLEPLICAGLEQLANRDAPRAALVAHELADLYGPRTQPLRDALLSVATKAKDLRLEARVLERWLAHQDAAKETTLGLADVYRSLDEPEAEALALVRAARSAIAPSEVIARLDALRRNTSGDVAVWVLEAEARALGWLGKSEEAAQAWLLFGSALWERADDPIGSIEAWLEAFGSEPVAFARLSESLARVATAEKTSDAFQDFALACDDPVRRASALVVASARSFALEQSREATDLGLQALREDPRRTDALVVIELASERTSDPESLDEAHELAAAGAKGRFGRRASHLRAARTLELRGYPEMAITHAIAAFEADPIEGSALLMMLRLAKRVDAPEVVEALCRVADGSSRTDQRASWWMHAARVASGRPELARRALDLGLRALLDAPSVETVELIGQVLEPLVRAEPEETTILELRLERARKALAPKLEGPVGGRIAITATDVSARVLQAPTLAMAWARIALACSGDIDEYDRLNGLASLLAREVTASAAFIDDVARRSEDRSGTTGPSLFAFSRALAGALGDEERQRKVEQAVARVTETQARQVDPFADLAADLSAESDRPGPGETTNDASREELAPPATPEPSANDVPLATARELSADVTDALARADQLAQRGEVDAAIALLESFVPAQPHVDPLLRRLYESSGHRQLPAVLVRMADRTVDPAAKVPLLVEAATLREQLGDRQEARAMWQLITEVAPGHREAWVRLERDATERGEWEMLAQILQRRSVVAASVTEVRELRLRRARLLDQELELPEQARLELDAVIADHGADGAVLLYRAELAERAGGKLSAAPFWVRAATIVPSRMDAVELLCKAARAFLDAGQHERAHEALSLTGDVRNDEVLTLMLETELASKGSPTRRGDLLDELAAGSQAQASYRAAWLMEAAEIAMADGNAAKALDRAKRAAMLVPSDVNVQLRAVFTTYRLEGLAVQDHVVDMLDRLRKVAPSLGPDDVDLHAFLSAECIEVLEGPDQALAYLYDRKRVAGVGPLIALGLADRLSIMGDPQSALPLFDITLRADNLRGVRTRAQVAFSAARAALRAGGSLLAGPYVALVEKEPGAELMLERLRADMTEIVPATDEVRRQLDQLARTSRGLERARALQQLARLSAARGTRGSNAEAEGYYVEAIAAAAADPTLQDSLEAERAAFRSRLTPSKLPPPVAARVPTVPPPPKAPTFDAPPAAAAAHPPLPLSPFPSAPPPRTDRVPPQRPAPAEPSLTSTISSQPPPPRPAESDARPARTVSDPDRENKLLQALAQGNTDAGDELASWLSGNPERTTEVVAIRRRQVVLQPHSLRHLELLRDAAQADKNQAYATAVHHVVCVLTGQPPPAAPSLRESSEDPNRLLTMVGRGVYGPAADVLGEVWRSAAHLFVREPAAYGLTGLERVSLTSPSPVGKAYTKAVALLGLGKTPVFQRRTPGAMSLGIAALSPMAVVVSGDVQEGPELEYRMACMLVGTTPPNAMLFGLPATAVRQLMRALLAAFGPPNTSRERVSESAVLAAELWRALPGAVQRRFGQLYRESEPFTYEDAWARALQATRRAGLLAVGDLSVALKDVLQDPGIPQAIDTGAQDAYRNLCRVSVSAADLVRFAASSEYAEVRWQEPRRTSSGSFRSVSA
jgi:tetratricopeptide (TPR) repeat protein